METPSPLEIYQTVRRYFIYVHLNSFGRCTKVAVIKIRFGISELIMTITESSWVTARQFSQSASRLALSRNYSN